MRYKLTWEEMQIWESEVEADSKEDAISKVMEDDVQDDAEVTRTYDISNVEATLIGGKK